MSVNKYDKVNNRLIKIAGNGGGSGSGGIRYDEETDMVQLFYNGEWVDWKSGVAYPVGTIVEFQYLEQVEEFTSPVDGIWKLEIYGAEGGYNGGKGGYAVGQIELSEGDKLYVCLGGAGSVRSNSAGYGDYGYNGGGRPASGGSGQTAGGGGGASHIALQKYGTGILTEYDSHREAVLLVAGGGGGGYYDSTAGGRNGNGGSGGGTNGGNGTGGYGTQTGGSQTSGYAFGQGQYATSVGGWGGAGGGWYGGRSTGLSCGGGGSGYVNTDRLITGTYNMDNGLRDGNGYAKLTFLGRGN